MNAAWQVEAVRWGCLTLVCAGCAFEPGQPFATVDASLNAHFDPLSDRALEHGWFKLNTDYQVRLDTLELHVDALELVDSGGPSELKTFDPAHPPAGYSLCHNGHCHRDDGALIAYDDIVAELAAGDTSQARTVVTFAPAVIDLLEATAAALDCQPNCDLPEGFLINARLTASGLTGTGLVRDGRAPPRLEGELEWQVDLSLLKLLAEQSSPVGVMVEPLGLAVNEDEPPQLSLDFALPTDPKLFDDLQFDEVSLTPSGTIDLDDPSGAEARNQLLEHFAAYDLSVHIQRNAED